MVLKCVSLAPLRRGHFRLSAVPAAIVGLIALMAGPALAGPPYLNDDPQPTDLGHWEIYNFVNGAKDHGTVGGEAGVDLNYGFAKDLQLTAVFPIGYTTDNGYSLDSVHTSSGVVELAAKYRFLHQDEKGAAPDIAIFPRLFVPTNRKFGPSRVNLLLPIWAQKDWGPWSVFGGGGYQINPGSGQRNFWQGGIALSRSLSKRFSLGAEVFAQTKDAVDGSGFTALNAALTYKLSSHWSVLASAGPTRRGGGQGSVFYLSLKADY